MEDNIKQRNQRDPQKKNCEIREVTTAGVVSHVKWTGEERNQRSCQKRHGRKEETWKAEEEMDARSGGRSVREVAE